MQDIIKQQNGPIVKFANKQIINLISFQLFLFYSSTK